jgi:hypothetical protein
MRITDKAFVYVPADETDIRRTFARVRRRLARERAEQARQQTRPGDVYLPLLPRQLEVQRMLDAQTKREGTC